MSKEKAVYISKLRCPLSYAKETRKSRQYYYQLISQIRHGETGGTDEDMPNGTFVISGHGLSFIDNKPFFHSKE